MGIDSTTKPVAASVAAELAAHLNLQDVALASEYVQFREDDEHYYVDIGRSQTIAALWQESFDRMKALDEKFNRTMLAILHELQAEELETSKTSGAQSAAATVALNAVTPSKHANRAGQQASSKRPAPGSSSVNKVILFRAKRGSGSSSTTANAAEQHNNQAACSTSNAAGTILSSSRGRKQLFETKNNSNNKDVVDSHEGRGSGALKPRNAASKQQAKPFIAVEQSIDGGSGGHHQQGANNLVDASVASSNTSTSVIPRTRAQARLLASATAIKQQQPSAVKVASSNAFGSASKSTRSRKAAAAADEEPRARQSGYTTPSRGTGGGGRQPRGGNFVSKEDSTTSKLRNATPLRSGAGRNVIDLSSVSVTNEAGGNGRGRAALTKPSTPFKHGGHGHSGSVSSMASSTCSNAAPGTPSSSSSSTASNLRRAEQERARQEKLLLSEDKRKKADEKKKDMLELRAARLKEERDARMEKIRENKLALKRQNEAKNREVLCSASKPVIKPAAQLTSSRVNARRRAALESVIAQPVLDLSESKPKTRAARNAANTRAAQKAAAAAASDSLVSFAKKETAAAAAAAKKESSTVKNSRNKKATAAGGKGGKSGTASSSSSASAASSATTTSGGKRKLFADDDDDDDVEDERDGGGSGANQKKKMPPPIPSTKPVATLSPIAKVAGADGQLPDGINTRLNETFTTEAVLQETIQPPSGPSGVKEKVIASKKCTTITATFSAGSSSSSTTTTATTATMTRFQATAAANWPGQVIYSDLRDNPTSVYNMQTGWFFSSKSTLEASGATPAHSTFVAEVAASASTSDQVTFAVPAIPPEGGRVGTPKSNKAGNSTDPKQNDNGNTTTNSSPFNMAKKLLTPKGSGGSGGGGSGGGGGGKKGSGSGKNKAELCTQYEMTPPPAVEPADNYDISRYIDSDDEEEQQRHEEAASGKRIPAWATGKSFLSALHKQFRQSYSELAAQTERLFTASLLPVPLDEMGLPVRNRYAVRSSSVNWKSAEAIRSAAAAGAAKGKK